MSRRVAPKTTGKELVKGIQRELEKEGIIRDISGFEKLVIHDHTKHRVITDSKRTAKHFKPNGRQVPLEVFVEKRSLAGCNDMRLAMRTMCDTLTADQIVDVFCKNRHWIINPQETANTLIGLMQDEMIDRDIVDMILDIQHPVWSQLVWKEDTALEEDFVEHWMKHPDMSNDRDDALVAFNEKKPNYLRRKDGEVSVTVTDNKRTERTYKFNLALELADLDTKRGRSRYFLADARTGSPFRTQYLNMMDWKKKQVDIRGKPSSLNRINLIGKPQYLTDKIREDKATVKVGDLVELERGESIMDLLRSGKTIRTL
jgi:hypothetical protein